MKLRKILNRVFEAVDGYFLALLNIQHRLHTPGKPSKM